jgi:hypothetical protein
VLGSIWALLMIAVIFMLPEVPVVLLAGSLFFPIYYVALSFALQIRRRQALRT